ncbi:MAG: glucuronate isomerase [Lentisphaeria bacterium]|nr:glucuronate isomerase [Lentisphaeria bacterium]
MKSDFLLTTELGARLFESVRDLPLIDWHNHLSLKELAENRPYPDLTALWVASDPYKHRAMRICGEKEFFITGDAAPHDKFLAWSRTLPKLPGNPLYHWSSLELQRIFGIEEELTPDTAEKIWRHANLLLKRDGFTPRGILERFDVEYAAPCTTFGEALPDLAGLEGIVPSLRGDDLAGLTAGVVAKSADLKELARNLEAGLEKLHAAGCRIADHALDAGFTYFPDDGKNEERFRAFKSGRLPEEEKKKLSSAVLRILCTLYAKLGWVVQFHAGALRQTSIRLRRLTGPVGGYAGIGNSTDVKALCALLDDLDNSPEGLPRTFLYTLNPADYAMFSVLSGSFPGDGTAGKLMPGPAWWYCDHLSGMKMCFESAASFSVLSLFPGMTTDSRSLLSLVRHEYFRRVFCSWLGEKAAADEMPRDFAILADLARKVCYDNAREIFVRKPNGGTVK